MQGFLDVRIRLCENTDAIRVFWPQLLKKSKDSSLAYWRYGWVSQTDHAHDFRLHIWRHVVMLR